MMNGKDIALHQLRAEEMRLEAERQQRAREMRLRRLKRGSVVTDLAVGLLKALKPYDAKPVAAVPEVVGQPETCVDA